MSNAFKLGSALKLVNQAANPSGPENGYLYYNTTDDRFKMYEDGSWQQLASKAYADSIAAGFDPKESVRAATTTSLPNTPTYAPALAYSFDSTAGVDDGTETITLGAHGLVNGDQVTVNATSGSLPGGLAASTIYYVISATATTIQLSVSENGSAINLTDATGTTNIQTVGKGATLTGSTNGALGNIDTSVTLVVGERLLVKNQVNAVHNGIYVVTQVGDGSNPYILTRATDFDGSPSAEVDGGEYVFVQSGTTLAGSAWVVTTTIASTIKLGIDSVTWTQVQGYTTLNSAYLAGNTITTSGGNVTIAGTQALAVTASNGIDLDSLMTLDYSGTSTGLAITKTGASGLGLSVSQVASSSSAAASLTSNSATVPTMILTNSNAAGPVLRLSSGGANTVTIVSGATSNYSLTLPVDAGTNGQFLQTNGSGALSWTTAASTLQSAYDNDVNGSDALITTNSTDGNVEIAGTEQLVVTATGGFEVGSAGQFAVSSSDGNISSIRGVSYTFPAADATGTLHSNGAGVLSWSAVSLTADVSGVLPIANGGTNSSATLTGNLLMVSNAGGTAIVEHSALTSAQVLYANGSGLPTGDANFTWNATTGLLIGATPIAAGSKLTMTSDTSTGVTMEVAGNTNQRPFIVGRKARGTIAAPTQAMTDDILMGFGGKGYDGAVYSGVNNAIIQMHAAEDFQTNMYGTYIKMLTTPIGQPSAVERFRIDDAVIVKDNGLKLANDNLNQFAHMTYLHGLTLLDNSTNALSEIELDGAVAPYYGGQIIEYRISLGGADTRVGTLLVALDTLGDVATITDTYTETADVGITWSVVASGSIATISYTATSTGFDRLMNATVTRYLA